MLTQEIYNKKLRERIMFIRIKNKQSVSSMAEKLNMTRSRYYHCEQGRAQFQPYDLYKIEKYFECSVRSE